MSSISIIAVEKGLLAPPVLLKDIGGHYGDSNWNQNYQTPVTNFEKYGAHQPLFHLFDKYNQECESQVKHLSGHKLYESATPFEKRGEFAAGPISSMWSLSLVLATSKRLPEAVHRFIARSVQNIFSDLAEMGEKIKIGPHPFDHLENQTLQTEQAKLRVLAILKGLAQKNNEHWKCYDGEVLAKHFAKDEQEQWNNAMREAHFKETIVKRKNLFQIFEEYGDSLPAERICDPKIRRYLKSILAHKAIRQQFLRILAIEPFRKVITESSLRLFAGILKKDAGAYLSNALSRLIECWDGIPAWTELIKFLGGRWGVEITDDKYQKWIKKSKLRTASQDISEALLKKIRNQNCRIITMTIVIAESHAFYYFVKSCDSISLEGFLSKVRECTSSDPEAPLWTECRHISKPWYGIWSQPPHASITKLLPAARIPLIYGETMSSTDLFQDFVKLFFGDLVYKGLERVQIRSIAHGDRKGREETEQSVHLADLRDRRKNLEMITMDHIMGAEASKTPDPSESQLQLGLVPRALPQIVDGRYYGSRPVTIVNVKDLSPMKSSARLSTRKREKAVSPNKSIANDLMVDETSITAKILSEMPAVRTSVTVFEKANINTPVTADKGTVTDHVMTSKERPLKKSTSRNKIDIVTTVSNRKAEELAESYQADLAPLQAISWDDDAKTERQVSRFNQIAENDRADFVPLRAVSFNDSASTLVETERPDPYFNYHEGPDHVLFAMIRLHMENDQDRIYLVPYDVANTNEIAWMIQRHLRKVVNSTRSSLENEETNTEIGKAGFKTATALFDQKKSRSYVRACGLVVYKIKNTDVMMIRPKAKGFWRLMPKLPKQVIC